MTYEQECDCMKNYHNYDKLMQANYQLIVLSNIKLPYESLFR